MLKVFTKFIDFRPSIGGIVIHRDDGCVGKTDHVLDTGGCWVICTQNRSRGSCEANIIAFDNIISNRNKNLIVYLDNQVICRNGSNRFTQKLQGKRILCSIKLGIWRFQELFLFTELIQRNTRSQNRIRTTSQRFVVNYFIIDENRTVSFDETVNRLNFNQVFIETNIFQQSCLC